VQAFVAGKADFAFMMAGTAVGLHVSGACDLVVLAEVDWSHGGDKMLVNKGKKLADLKGKRIGIYEDSPAVMMFLAAKLKAERLAIGDFKIVVIEDMESLASQFTNGRIAVAISYEPFVERATANGACEVIATTADFPGVMPEVLVARRASLARIPPGRVAALIAGWLDAVEWSQDPANAKAFADLCASKVFVEEKVDPGSVAGLLANVRIHGVPELRHRNFEDVGLPTFLRECAGFAGHRGTFDVTRLFDGKPLQRAIELHTAPSAVPAK
jgi:NitT/TauT family transport system substrate-binding protein